MRLRAALLPLASVVLVATVLVVQAAAGGGGYRPARSADPCTGRQVRSVSKGLDALAEEVTLLGLDGAACRLHVTRERLVLTIADPATRRSVQTRALHDGLRDAVHRLARESRLPRVSTLLADAVDESDLPGIAKSAVKAVPDSAVDGLLSTEPLLTKAVGRLDIDSLLAHLDDPSRLQSTLRDAVLRAAADEIVDDIPLPF